MIDSNSKSLERAKSQDSVRSHPSALEFNNLTVVHLILLEMMTELKGSYLVWKTLTSFISTLLGRTPNSLERNSTAFGRNFYDLISFSGVRCAIHGPSRSLAQQTGANQRYIGSENFRSHHGVKTVTEPNLSVSWPALIP